jgi:hypothetical protein
VPWKYGIIFKEKIVVQPIDHTAVSFNVRLLKGGVDLEEKGARRKFMFTIMDNG